MYHTDFDPLGACLSICAACLVLVLFVRDVREEYKIARDELAAREAWPPLDSSKPDEEGFISLSVVESKRLFLNDCYRLHLVNNGCSKELGHGLNLKGDPDEPQTMLIHIDSVEELARRFRLAISDRSLYCPGYLQQVKEYEPQGLYW
jgi:hypothetical protein